MSLSEISIEPALDQFPNLMQLRLWECPSQTLSAPEAPPKRYDTITSLSLVLAENEHQGSGQTSLQSLTLPSLVDLNLEVSKYVPRTNAWSTDPLIAFLQRSAPPNLASFSIQNVVITNSDLVAALELMPSLTNLSIDDSIFASAELPPIESPTARDRTPITSRLINSLHSSTPSTLRSSNSTHITLLPKLRSLNLYLDGTSFDDAAFIDMISSRWLPDTQCASEIRMSCLKTVVMNFRTRAVDEKLYRPFHLFDTAGMMVTVISQGRTLI